MSMKENVSFKIFDPRGNGGGYISPTITGDHQNRITDYTAITIQGGDYMGVDNSVVRRLTPV